MKCDNCHNGNHTGTNGTPGCEGGACNCRCTGNRLATMLARTESAKTRAARESVARSFL